MRSKTYGLIVKCNQSVIEWLEGMKYIQKLIVKCNQSGIKWLKGIKYIIKKNLKCNRSGIEDLVYNWYELKKSKKKKKKWFDSALTHSPFGSAPLHSSVRPPSVLLPQELPLVLPHTLWRLPQNSGHLARQYQRGRGGISTRSLAKSYHYPNHSTLLGSDSTVGKRFI